jgi:NSS family neurotransmitter:Na+ symporter
MLPVGGVLIALFAGWILDKKIIEDQMPGRTTMFSLWRFLIRFVAPAAVSLVFVMTFI